MKIYISGKISGLSEEQYIFFFRMAKKRVIKETDCFLEDIVNPLDLKPLLGIKSWLFFMVTDIAALRKCTHICMMSNWKESKGAVIEYYFAKFIFKLKIIWL